MIWADSSPLIVVCYAGKKYVLLQANHRQGRAVEYPQMEFLVGALRLPDRPLLIDARLLKTRTSVEVCAALERMTSFFQSLSFEGFEITDPPRIIRLHPDRARELTALYFQKFLSNHRSIYHTLTTGYDPQANGTAERSVGLMKALSARCLTTSGLPQEFWGYAVKYAAQSLLCSSLQRKQKSPPFGSQVIAQVRKVKYPEQRSITGRLLYWDHLQDQLSYLEQRQHLEHLSHPVDLDMVSLQLTHLKSRMLKKKMMMSS